MTLGTQIHVTQLGLCQLADARYACRHAAAALLRLASGAADPTLESEVRRLQCTLDTAADELGGLIDALRMTP